MSKQTDKTVFCTTLKKCKCVFECSQDVFGACQNQLVGHYLISQSIFIHFFPLVHHLLHINTPPTSSFAFIAGESVTM